ncbi:zinc finger MYM-type protein 4-like isoform 2-T2 [Pholidichthys leucotaenia]
MPLPIKIRLRMSQDAAGAATKKKNNRQPCTRRIDKESFNENPRRRSARGKSPMPNKQKGSSASENRSSSKSKNDQANYDKKQKDKLYSRLYRLNMSLAESTLRKRNLTKDERKEAELWLQRKQNYNAGCNRRMKKMNDKKRKQMKDGLTKHVTRKQYKANKERKKKQRQRAGYSDEKKQAINARRRELYAEKKAKERNQALLEEQRKVTEGTDEESMDVVFESGTSDVGDPMLNQESSHELVEQEEDMSDCPEKEMKTKETELDEIKAEEVQTAASASLSQDVFTETGETDSTSESDKEPPEEKNEDECRVQDENEVEDNSLEQSPARPHDSEDKAMGMTYDGQEEVKYTDEKTDVNSDTEKTDANAEPQNMNSDTEPQSMDADADAQSQNMDADTKNVDADAEPQDLDADVDPQNVDTDVDPQNLDADADTKNMDADIATKESDGTEQEKVLSDCQLKSFTADDLDEMMDIGTVDQLEQEAQMKEEDQSSLDMESSRSPAASNTASMAEDSNSMKEELDETAFDPLPSSSSPPSDTKGSTGENSSSTTELNGLKVVQLTIPKLDEKILNADSQLEKSPSPPLVTIKDEPVDEEYEQALTSSASVASVKDEAVKDDLKIGSVYSVPSSTETQTLPIVNPSSAAHMTCSTCNKSLLKGQTAFQRKGSSAIFCSTQCLSASTKGTKVCHSCQKTIARPQNVILAQDGKGLMKEFCSQNCLNSFNCKKSVSVSKKTPPSTSMKSQPVSQPPICSICSKYCVSKHEVILNGSVHKICSDACFNRFRTMHNLTMAGCANCGSFVHDKPLMLKLDEGCKTMCNAECLAKFKGKSKISQQCMMCHTPRMISEMVDNKNADDSVNLFCTSSCVMAFKVQTVSASGARISCDNCGKITVPSYHLAMSDTSIRNFCSLPCVMAFQERFKQSTKQVSVFTKLPSGTTQIHPITQIQPQPEVRELHKLNCFQCTRTITYKPELIQIKDKMVFLCSVDCSNEYKKDQNVMSLCEYCKIEKITRDVKRINGKDCYFCSDGCKLLFRHDLSKNWGKHCHSCVYCHCVSKKLVMAQYGGSTEDFCSEECRSKYTMLFCHVAKCDSCGRKGKLKQSLPLLGEVKHFCDINCLLRFCCHKVTTQGDVPKAGAEATPVISSVMSLATPPGQLNVSERVTRQSKASDLHSKKSGHFNIPTEMRTPPVTAPQKVLKNKALLCKPLVQNKGVSCKTQTVEVESQTDDLFPKVMIVPVPVPIYLPVPMTMYSQYTPKPVTMPLPLPVPMFLPVTMDSAERVIETIQEIKEKIPADPYEAELILMAEMVAEDDEQGEKQEPRKLEKVTERQEAGAPDDHASNFSEDLDTDDLTSFLNNWDPTSDSGVQSPNRPFTSEKLNPIMDVSSEAYAEQPLPPSPPGMDIEADFTVEILENMARLRERSRRSLSPPPTAGRRKQAPRKAREKRTRGRKSQRSKFDDEASPNTSHKNVTAEALKIKSEYGVDAWKRWIQWRQTQPNLENPRIGSRPIELKEDLLRCTTAELSYGLCCFIAEVKRPNGELYTPDSLFYLCLGIQQYLFQNGRVENIFMDRFYSRFSTEFTNLLKNFKPSITPRGYVHSRVEEEYLWECKQLGAYSPIVLLNTLLFFSTKFFGFTTVEQHRQLSFAHLMRCTKTNPDNTKTTFLRFYPPLAANESECGSQSDGVPAKKRKEEENKEDILEMMENLENPLRCPVRLYEFYLSK